MTRSFDEQPYSPEEARVAKYLVELTDIGGGEDPVGFLIASHATLSQLVPKPKWVNRRPASPRLEYGVEKVMRPRPHLGLTKDSLQVIAFADDEDSP
jgi:hypothetical protein